MDGRAGTGGRGGVRPEDPGARRVRPGPGGVRRPGGRRGGFGASSQAGAAGLGPRGLAGHSARRAGRQGDHVRLRWPLVEAAGHAGRDEDRHVRGRRRVRGDGRAGAAGSRRAAGDRAALPGREPPRRRRHTTGGRRDPPWRPDQRGREHRCRGPARARRRPGLRRARPRRGRGGGHRDADWGGDPRARHGATRRSSATPTRWPPDCPRRGRPPGSRCGGCLCTPTTRH